MDRGQHNAIANNLLNRQFKPDSANQKWVADFAYIWTAEGWLYVAVVLHLFSRRVLGWSMQSSMESFFSTLKMECVHRKFYRTDVTQRRMPTFGVVEDFDEVKHISLGLATRPVKFEEA